MRRLRIVAVAALAAMSGCSPSTAPSDALLAATEWHEFQGTWTATGSRHTIPLGADRRASIANFDGSLLLAGPVRLGLLMTLFFLAVFLVVGTAWILLITG